MVSALSPPHEANSNADKIAATVVAELRSTRPALRMARTLHEPCLPQLSGAASSVAQPGSPPIMRPSNETHVHPRTPEIIVAERGAVQRRASAEVRVVARRRGTNGGARRGRRSAGGTSSYAAVGGAQSSYASRMAQSHPDELLRRALALPPDKRLALATELLNSVEERQDERWEREWLAELDRRSAAIDRGEDKLEDWETVKARLRAELRAK